MTCDRCTAPARYGYTFGRLPEDRAGRGYAVACGRHLGALVSRAVAIDSTAGGAVVGVVVWALT